MTCAVNELHAALTEAKRIFGSSSRFTIEAVDDWEGWQHIRIGIETSATPAECLQLMDAFYDFWVSASIALRQSIVWSPVFIESPEPEERP